MGCFMKKVLTITGIRPDFIRMSELFKKLDKEFDHTLIHTGQHYDNLLSDVFFKELDIRKPDYNLGIGGPGKEHFHQSAEASVKIIELLRDKKIKPNIIIFLGDSNSVVTSVALKKEGYFIGHIEAGMRSGDRRMLEEINRTVCDHCSDLHFVYHEDYKENLIQEGLPAKNIYVVGNTIVEVCNNLKAGIMSKPKAKDFILVDIHRPENFKYKNRLDNILKLANFCKGRFGISVRMLRFGRTMLSIEDFGLNTGGIEFVDLMPYKQFLKAQYDSLFLISDSGTAQEEPALLKTPVLVPRDYTERPQSAWAGCSFMLNIASPGEFKSAVTWLNSNPEMDNSWLGDGTTSEQIIEILKDRL